MRGPGGGPRNPADGARGSAGEQPEEEAEGTAPWGAEGLHSERTLLAWIRTGTALAAGGLGGAGVAARHMGSGPAALPFVLAALCGAVLLARTHLRHRRLESALHEGKPLDVRADALLAWLGVLAVVAGAAAFVLAAP
ncbi:DUF202 domain-containing protein [Sphaerisporangium melleum]|uniref:DUF202 domain-containing protein n=1 Tax=Sphaerisporangium melleum TaxID=321316 RepID=UPI001E547EF9|nr:DUF202 domain-containing protein [Sphaerisporangium melleum]